MPVKASNRTFGRKKVIISIKGPDDNCASLHGRKPRVFLCFCPVQSFWTSRWPQHEFAKFSWKRERAFFLQSPRNSFISKKGKDAPMRTKSVLISGYLNFDFYTALARKSANVLIIISCFPLNPRTFNASRDKFRDSASASFSSSLIHFARWISGKRSAGVTRLYSFPEMKNVVQVHLLIHPPSYYANFPIFTLQFLRHK